MIFKSLDVGFNEAANRSKLTWQEARTRAVRLLARMRAWFDCCASGISRIGDVTRGLPPECACLSGADDVVRVRQLLLGTSNEADDVADRD